MEGNCENENSITLLLYNQHKTTTIHRRPFKWALLRYIMVVFFIYQYSNLIQPFLLGTTEKKSAISLQLLFDAASLKKLQKFCFSNQKQYQLAPKPHCQLRLYKNRGF